MLKAVFMTDCGRVRQHNEDNGGIFEREGSMLVLVADGMGGHRAGDVASSMTLSYFREIWDTENGVITADEAEKWLKTHIENVNSLLFRHAEQNQECQGMGTTLVAALCTDRFATIANIGDSRCYLQNENGFKQITEDHTLVNELVRTGQISREDAEHHPRKNVIVRALGTELNVEADIKSIIFEEGDYILLCSDGLSNKVSEQDLKLALNSEADLEQKAGTLIAKANDNGGEDNITLIIVQYNSEKESR